MQRSLLTLSDVFATGHHAAVCAQVKPGHTVAVVGDGAVGLSGVLAAKRLGAERIIALSRHADRQALATEFGATDIIAARGEEAVEAIKEMTAGVGVDATLECVGTGQSMKTAIDIARAGSMVGYVGVPHGVELPIGQMFSRNVGVRGGGAPVPRLPPRTARRRARRAHQPRPRPRLRDQPRRDRRGLRRDGRAPRNQVPRAGREHLMAAWTGEELQLMP